MSAGCWDLLPLSLSGHGLLEEGKAGTVARAILGCCICNVLIEIKRGPRKRQIPSLPILYTILYLKLLFFLVEMYL